MGDSSLPAEPAKPKGHPPRSQRRSPPATKQAALEDGLNLQVSYYKRQAEKAFRLARQYKWIAVVISALVTVLLGLDLAEVPTVSAWLPRVAFLLSTLATAVVSFEGFNDPRGELARCREAYLELLQLRARYYYDVAAPTTAPASPEERAAQVDKIVEEYWERLQKTLARIHAQRIEVLVKRTHEEG